MTPVRPAEWPAAAVLLGVAVTWGVSFAVVKAVVGEVSPSRLVGWRFLVATFTLLETTGHIPILAGPDEVVAAIREYLA